jgi:hypothetical protein
MTTIANSGPVICVEAKPLTDRTWLGTVTLLIAIFVLRPEVADFAILLAALVIVPMGFGLIGNEVAAARSDRLLMAATRLQFPTALLLLTGFAMPVGKIAAALAVPWFGVTFLAAAWGARSFCSRKTWHNETRREAGFAIGMMFLTIGGMWTVFFRLGSWPGGFPQVIAKLTAVHFHYAGFALPVIAAMVARVRGGKLNVLLVPTIAAATLLLAVGITVAPLVELTAALTLAAAGCWLAVLQVRIAFSAKRPVTFVALATSALAMLSGMAMVSIYAAGEFLAPSFGLAEYSGGGWIDIATMIRFHGMTMALGFSLLGLAGWHLWVEEKGTSRRGAEAAVKTN